MMYDEINMEQLKSIPPDKLQLMIDMLEDMKDKSMEQRMQILFTYGSEMKNRGLKFTKNESNIIINSMKHNLSGKEQKKLDMMITMMEMMK